MLPDIRDYDELYRRFRWQVPAAYNIGVDVCDRWAAVDARRTAIVHARPDGTSEIISFGSLRETSNRLANALRAHGIKRGDRAAILLPQAPAARRPSSSSCSRSTAPPTARSAFMRRSFAPHPTSHPSRPPPTTRH